MSCDNPTTCTAIVDLVSLSNLEPRDFRTADETHVACDQPVTRCRSGPSDRSKAKAHIIPDSTQTVPEYVWGDEGPVND